MDISIFTNKNKKPENNDLKASLGSCYPLWIKIRADVFKKYPDATEEWNYSGIKYGWSFRIKDKKRAIIYLLPRDKYFKTALVFGQKAYDRILDSHISGSIKKELENARVYAEGRGIRIDIKDDSLLADIFKLIEIKLAN
jgi:hypothetical protein